MSYCVDFELLIVDKQRTATKRLGIERGAMEINQPGYFRKALTLK